MIYNIKISFVNILFILSKQYQDNDTLKFMNEFQLPYIYFNNENNEQNFLYNNSSKILKFELSIEYHYATNKYSPGRDTDSMLHDNVICLLPAVMSGLGII